MELKLIKETDMPLLARKEMVFNMTFAKGATPSVAQVRAEVAKMLKAKEHLVAVRHIYQNFGSGEAEVMVNVYKNHSDLKSLEKKKLVVEPAQEKPKEEKAKEEPETPKEEEKSDKAVE